MKKQPTSCIITTSDGVLCKDGLFRRHVTFGTESFCCRFVKTKAWATRIVRKLRLNGWTIHYLYEGDVVEHDGHVIRS